MPFPLTTQAKVAPAVGLVTLKTTPAESEQTDSGPVMVQVGFALTVIVRVQVAEQPFAVTVEVQSRAARERGRLPP